MINNNFEWKQESAYFGNDKINQANNIIKSLKKNNYYKRDYKETEK